ncbi:MAG: hypothetical protein FNNCIFGK_00974 [Bacteroidia bacterium]|nr:hypothetical protein [Bacteroidia bacterium]
MMKKILNLILCVTFTLPLQAQIRQLADSVLRGSTDSVRISSNNILIQQMSEFLKADKSFTTSFDSVKSISTIKSSDGLIRFYQWAMPLMESNTFQIYGFMQVQDKKTKTLNVWQLTDINEDKYSVSEKILTPDNYYAAVYYSIIPLKSGKKTIYTLLGWRGNTPRTSLKVIDVLTFKNNKPVFGKKIFTSPPKMLPVLPANKCARIIFEYNANAVMSLKYYPNKKQIVFDHISPSKESLKGLEEFYGPDMSYDAFKWKKGKWNGIADIDIRNKNNTDGKKTAPIKDSELHK